MTEKDINIELQFNLQELNVILGLLSQLPYVNSATVINAIHKQVIPQIPKEFFESAETSETEESDTTAAE